MAVQIRLMGQDHAEVAAVMAALVAGEPVTVMADGGLARNHRDSGARAFGMAQLPGYRPHETEASPPATRRPRRAYSERADRRQLPR
ncbi:hypothetical protein GCM10010174_69960 [Kutzneria viridogrisea]|uniref:Transposase n=1 Tax=Kutzneria viridogrisea TaxID=47990 RepID=A0ABR6BAX4_9PSEU|nr:hypothetical protein [Kutzneria viridogrisea]